MSMEPEMIQVKSFGTVIPKDGNNFRSPYAHQEQALKCLNIVNREPEYSTLVVLPTGGGKTYTASTWLLKNAIAKHKKVLWIAHRQMLLDQAAESFQKFAYKSEIPQVSSFNYRIVSGYKDHDSTNHIEPSDDILIIGKDSIARNLNRLDAWLKGEDELFFIIDEAHHSIAKTYRKIIDYVHSKVTHVKLIGLTATPFRTVENEKGLLAKIFCDGIKDGTAVHGDVGIAYQVALKELINRQILAKPFFESYQTDEEYDQALGLDALKKIEHLDILPKEIAESMSKSAARNNLIVSTYKEGIFKYGPTIVFALDVNHAIALSKLFNDAGISADYIVSAVKDMATGVTISQADNDRKIEAYKNGDIQVLINVNILTEGVDLPKTKTVFLARPTVSTILMTQMVGRALRGTAAGGTSSAYIVSFVDNWNEHIAWVNPENIFDPGSNNDFAEDKATKVSQELRMISIAKIEEFAKMLDGAIDTTALEQVAFSERIPIGMYSFTYLEKAENDGDAMDHACQVMIYNSTREAYKNMLEELPELFKSFGITEEYLDDEQLSEMEAQCRDTYFIGEMIPSYDERDVKNILKYYAQYETVPKFYTFDDIDRNKLDVSKIAAEIVDRDMKRSEETAYINSLWDNADNNMLQLFFGNRKVYYVKEVQRELFKLEHGKEFTSGEDNVKFGQRALEDMPLYEIGKYNPQLEKDLRDGAFAKAQNNDGTYSCANCGLTNRSRSWFQVDHIIALNNGGKSVPENLQILCRTCNARKSDK